MELLVDAVMRWASGVGCRWLTLGMAPLSGQVRSLLRVARNARVFYDFEGVRYYKAKLRPLGWSPLYLGFPKDQSGVLGVLDVLAAFAGGSVLRFGLRSVLRGRGALSRPRLMS